MSAALYVPLSTPIIDITRWVSFVVRSRKSGVSYKEGWVALVQIGLAIAAVGWVMLLFFSGNEVDVISPLGRVFDTTETVLNMHKLAISEQLIMSGLALALLGGLLRRRAPATSSGLSSEGQSIDPN